ncbi:MAG: hypothetical protein AB8B61_08760 [Cyclobacteriaceae bacterium]
MMNLEINLKKKKLYKFLVTVILLSILVCCILMYFHLLKVYIFISPLIYFVILFGVRRFIRSVRLQGDNVYVGFFGKNKEIRLNRSDIDYNKTDFFEISTKKKVYVIKKIEFSNDIEWDYFIGWYNENNTDNQ